jgi:hypothetical protein
MSPLKRKPSMKSQGRSRKRRGFGLSASVQVNLTPEEKAFIEKKAAAEGVTLSEYFAIAALKAYPTRKREANKIDTVKTARRAKVKQTGKTRK